MNQRLRNVCVGFFSVLVFIAFVSCSAKKSLEGVEVQRDVPAIVPQGLKGPGVDPSTVSAGSSTLVSLNNGAQVLVAKPAGVLMLYMEGAFTDDAFHHLHAVHAEKSTTDVQRVMSDEINDVFKKLRTTHAIPLQAFPSVGYFSFLMPYHEEVFSDISRMKFNYSIVLNPVVYDPGVLARAKSYRPEAEGLVMRSGTSAVHSGFSGIERIGAPELVRLAEEAMGDGTRVNGSSVRVGVTDTGITYNHPTFLSQDLKNNRVVYMKDFTGEGAIYFNPEAKFSAKESQRGRSDELLIDAEVIVTPKLPTMPVGDIFTEVKGLPIRVSGELKKLLLTSSQDPKKGPKLGIFFEESLQGDREKVDINNNGRLNDKLFVLYIPGGTPDEDTVFFDSTGEGDFTQSRPIGDWNKVHSMINVFAEKIGFSFRDMELPSQEPDKSVQVRGVSIVGFDPGDHGSHVSGIIAGRKTIQNDPDDTLARGVAPEAALYMNRVCANNGGCNATAAFIDLVTNAGVEVVNMSLGGLSPFNDGLGVQETIINRLSMMHNVSFIISAGNSGPGHQTVGSPSTARLSLSVAATASRSMIQRQYQWPGLGNVGSSEEEDFVLFFSSRGPTSAGGFKPTLSAPGTELSSIQLNTAPGAQGGMAVYWGTSMAAPTATGGYALLLDAVKKYNTKHAQTPLTTDAMILRQVLIETARPFDVVKLDPKTSVKSRGQYTWIDEGAGMLDLPAAWKKLIEYRDQKVPSAVQMNGESIELDYQVMVSAKSPNGIPYDGSRKDSQGTPAFGTGVYLDYDGKETLKQIHIARRLSARHAISKEAGELTRNLLTTKDDFILKTVSYGSNKGWLRAGVRDELDCWQSETDSLTVLGRGVEVQVNEQGAAVLVPHPASILNLCINRNVVRHELEPGDHGALIYGYRTVGGKVSPVPSFIVPVYITVPHQVLKGSAAYEVKKKVKSFGVDRNYVLVPEGTSVVKVTLEVPESESCSGVELMAYDGGNTSKVFKTRQEARVVNCDADGTPTQSSKRKLTFFKTNPHAGIWDLHVFGIYKYKESDYSLRVDYIIAQPSVDKIQGNLKALNGSLIWTLKESSSNIVPDSEKSTIELDSLVSESTHKIIQGAQVWLSSPLGQLRAYPQEVETVEVSIGGASGSDLDMVVVECPVTAKTPDPSLCEVVGSSGGPTDVESVEFAPKAGKLYGVGVNGFDIKSGETTFHSNERLYIQPDEGTITVTGQSPAFTIGYSFSIDSLLSGKVLTHPLFTSGRYKAVGELSIHSEDETVLGSIPMEITK